MRVNAGLGMARITERVHQIAMSHQPNAVGAVGQVTVFPNSRNVIPGKVVFTVDIRSPEQAKLDAMRAEVERAAHAVAAEMVAWRVRNASKLRWIVWTFTPLPM